MLPQNRHSPPHDQSVTLVQIAGQRLQLSGTCGPAGLQRMRSRNPLQAMLASPVRSSSELRDGRNGANPCQHPRAFPSKARGLSEGRESTAAESRRSLHAGAIRHPGQRAGASSWGVRHRFESWDIEARSLEVGFAQAPKLIGQRAVSAGACGDLKPGRSRAVVQGRSASRLSKHNVVAEANRPRSAGSATPLPAMLQPVSALTLF